MKINLRKLPLNIYLSLFIFCMINREFLLFGLDLRFVMVPLGILLIIFYLFLHRGVIYIRRDENYKQFKLLLIFYLWVFICNISWLYNSLPIDTTKFINELILIGNIFLSIIIIMLYQDEISSSFIKKNIIFSCLILVVSIILTGMGFTAEQISASPDVLIKYQTGNGVTHTNLFGWDFRPAGYASDPNYATLLMLIACSCVMNLSVKRKNKILLLLPFILGICLSFSKTILIASVFAMSYVYFFKKIDKNKPVLILITKILIITVIFISVSSPFISQLKEILPQTMTTRLVMWESAVKLFGRNIFLGSGITSARSFFSIRRWYVQTHNTYLQILSETGLIGILLFYKLMINTIKRNYDNSINLFMTIVFIIFMIDFETIAMQFFIYVTLLCQIGRKEDLINVGEKSIISS